MNFRDPPVEDFLCALQGTGVGGLSLPAVGLEAEPGLGGLAGAVQGSLPLAVPHVHVGPLGQEQPGGGGTTTRHQGLVLIITGCSFPPIWLWDG